VRPVAKFTRVVVGRLLQKEAETPTLPLSPTRLARRETRLTKNMQDGETASGKNGLRRNTAHIACLIALFDKREKYLARIGCWRSRETRESCHFPTSPRSARSDCRSRPKRADCREMSYPWGTSLLPLRPPSSDALYAVASLVGIFCHVTAPHSPPPVYPPLSAVQNAAKT
jgi:hypothetical protein